MRHPLAQGPVGFVAGAVAGTIALAPVGMALGLVGGTFVALFYRLPRLLLGRLAARA